MLQAWHSLNLGDPLLADRELDRIRQLFQAECTHQSGNKGMALFIRHESEGQLHCEVKLYFSPAATAVAGAVGATVCDKPSPEDLGLFAGSDDAWTVLFTLRP